MPDSIERDSDGIMSGERWSLDVFGRDEVVSTRWRRAFRFEVRGSSLRVGLPDDGFLDGMTKASASLLKPRKYTRIRATVRHILITVGYPSPHAQSATLIEDAANIIMMLAR